MKRFLITIVVFCTAVFAVNAQNLSSLSTAAKLAYKYLAAEGYRPSIDEDNDVVFKAQGYNFYIDNNVNDDTYLRIVMFPIKSIDMDNTLEHISALYACNEINYGKKLVKAYMSDKGKVSLSAQTYLGVSIDVSEFLSTAIDFLISATDSWFESYNEMME